jgi:hypothetical protein
LRPEAKKAAKDLSEATARTGAKAGAVETVKATITPNACACRIHSKSSGDPTAQGAPASRATTANIKQATEDEAGAARTANAEAKGLQEVTLPEFSFRSRTQRVLK